MSPQQQGPTSVGQVNQTAAYPLVWTGWKDGRPGAIATGATYAGRPIPPGGCAGQAQRSLGIVDGLEAGVVASLDFAMFDQSKRDRRVVAGLAAWSSCMATKGFRHQDPFTVAAAFVTGPAPTGPEINAALADIGCKQSTNLVGIWYGVECAYERAAVERIPQSCRPSSYRSVRP
jgi:hypothetical protein